jgi:propionyl-CoA synthetase
LKRRSNEIIKQYDLSSLKTILAGERCDLATLKWYNEHIPIQAKTIGGKQSGWPMIANMLGTLPIKPGSW